MQEILRYVKVNRIEGNIVLMTGVNKPTGKHYFKFILRSEVSGNVRIHHRFAETRIALLKLLSYFRLHSLNLM